MNGNHLCFYSSLVQNLVLLLNPFSSYGMHIFLGAITRKVCKEFTKNVTTWRGVVWHHFSPCCFQNALVPCCIFLPCKEACLGFPGAISRINYWSL